jgi:hypothetical protein
VPPECDPYDAAKVRAMLMGYAERWGESLASYDVESIEKPFDMPLVRGWRLQGKRDGVIVDRAGHSRRLVLEHKTSSVEVGPGSDYVARLAVDTQCSLYMLEGDFDGVLYDIIRKPALKPYQPGKKRETAETPDEYMARCIEAIAEAPDAYYQRAEVVRLDGELAEAKADLIGTVRSIEGCAKRGHYERNDDSCYSYGSRCSYWSLCTRTGSESDYAVSDEQHPELQEGK